MKSMHTTIEKIEENPRQIDPENVWARICEQVVPQSAPEETQRRPKSAPKRPKGTPGAPQSFPGVLREYLRNAPRLCQERSKIRWSAPRAPQSVPEAI